MSQRARERTLEDEGIPDIADQHAAGRQSVEMDEDVMLPPRDYPQAVNEFGTTAAESVQGESLEMKLRREVGDEEPGDDEQGVVRRLVGSSGSDEGLATAFATDDDGGMSAEELAMHVVEPPE
ncbi:MAG TPA: hypothetical protein VNE62_11045 [Actinomycetota bacterium]|nr:hypothetical protein [Actinomycetota bacterium]